MSQDQQNTLFNLSEFVRPDAMQVITSRTVDVKKHTRTIRPRAVRKAIAPASKAAAPETVADDTTVRDARAWVEQRVEHGVLCPVCTKFAKVYTRTITASMARALVTIYLRSKGEYVHLDRFLMKYGQHSGAAMPALLRHWQLIEKHKGKRADESSAVGFYRITERGKLFAENKIAINKFVRLYDDRSLFLESDEKILIVDALKKQFDYAALMRGEG